MVQGVYLAAVDAGTGKATLALGVADLLSRRAGTVGVFRPVVPAGTARDTLVETLRTRYAAAMPYESTVGLTEEEAAADPDAALAEILRKYHALTARCDAVVILGTDFTGVGMPSEFSFNARMAANLSAPVMLVVNGDGKTPEEIAFAADLARKELESEYATEFAVAVNRAAPEQLDQIRAALDAQGGPAAYVIPRTPLLTAPTVTDLMTAVGGTLLFGDRELAERDVRGLTLAATTLPSLLRSLATDDAVVVSSDRAAALLPGLVAAHRSATFPTLSAVVLTEAEQLAEPIRELLEGLRVRLPIIGTGLDPLRATTLLYKTRGRISPETPGKIDNALKVFAEAVDEEDLLRRMCVAEPTVITPIIFEHRLLERARADRKHVVLPEGEEERILRAADLLLRREVADLTLLGDPEVIASRARDLGLDVSKARIIDPATSEVRARLAAEYAKRRAHKGVTLEFAEDTMRDVSYFGTMLVAAGLADGMVSGAVHTTAHTIRPAFEVLREGLVSSVFFMGLSDRVLVYGDCAVNPDPTAEQLAEITVAAAGTAKMFGVDPKVAMLSYSTGTSGSGVDVDKVRAATALVHERAPQLPVEGPIQYDAAADPGVAATKLPGSSVAGQATVFVAPDLNTGNNLYKAVQRTAGAVAVGPVLQGLKRPVNDLSRGATVQDIINTVAITAIQAQH